MKRSFGMSLALAAAMCLGVAKAACHDVHQLIVRIHGMARDFVIGLLAPIQKLAQPKAGTVQHSTTLTLVAARAYVARSLRRDPPRLEAQWRMCPSV